MPPAGSRWGDIKLDRALHSHAILLGMEDAVLPAASGPLHMLPPSPLAETHLLLWTEAYSLFRSHLGHHLIDSFHKYFLCTYYVHSTVGHGGRL